MRICCSSTLPCCEGCRFHRQADPCRSRTMEGAFPILFPATEREREREREACHLRLEAFETDARVRVCVCVCVCVCQRKTKDRADGKRKKVPIPLDGIRTCTSGIRAHRAFDYTTRVRPPRVSRNKHFRHSPVSSIAKQSCTKHCNSYLRDHDAKHLQGPPLSRTKRARERRRIELTV